MHRVADPRHGHARGARGVDERRQHGRDLVLAEARDQHQLARLPVGVEDGQNAAELLRLHRGPALDANRVLDAAEVLHVRAVQRTRTVTNPQEVCAKVVRVAASVGEGVGRLVLEHKAFVGGEDIDLVDAGVAGGHLTDSHEELDAVAQLLEDVPVRVARVRVLHRVQVPLVRIAERGEASRDEGPDVVDGGSRVEVGLQQAVGVGRALVNRVAVDVVSPEGSDLLLDHDLLLSAVDDLLLLDLDGLPAAAARLGELASAADDADDGHVGAPDEDEAHLQNDANLVLDQLLLAVHKALGAVATLQNEGLALSSQRKATLQALHLPRADERGELADVVEHFLEDRLGLFRVGRLLLDRELPPAVDRPAIFHIVVVVHRCELSVVQAGAMLVYCSCRLQSFHFGINNCL
mmetsp:Transcript_15252/g.59646  ORF Transcript_15252/g.59646 Transcript_15252/m.59646 type:complete len:407 (-) Transcript_15252:43-1263(-)